MAARAAPDGHTIVLVSSSYIAAETTRWGKVIKDAGIKAE